jgi:DNA polymerase-3 subunit gamma/tau
VLPTILSRCQRFDFRRIPLEALERHLGWIAEQEGIGITPEALHVVAQRAQGGLRDAESLLDQLSLLPPPVEASAVWELLGAVPEQELLELAQALADAEALGLLETCRSLLERGREPTALLQGLASLLRDLVLAGVAPDRLELTSVSPQLREHLPALARRIGKARLLHWQAQLRGSEQQLRHSVNPRLWLEVLLLGLLDEASGPSSMPAASPPVATPAAVTAAPPAAAPPPAQPVAVPTAAAAPNLAPAQPSAPRTSLADLWAQILASLELPSTRMLLSQQARLVRLDDQRAVVQVAGTWMAMVQTRQALVEQAISRALGGARQLTLEAAGDPPPVPDPQPPQLPQLAPTAGPSSTAPGATPPALPGPAATMAAPAAAPPPAPSATTPPRAAEPVPPAAAPPSAPANDPARQPLSHLDEKTRQLAEFFNGEVVEIEGPLDEITDANAA